MHNKEYGNQAIEINDTILGMKLYLAVNDNSTTDNINTNDCDININDNDEEKEQNTVEKYGFYGQSTEL